MKYVYNYFLLIIAAAASTANDLLASKIAVTQKQKPPAEWFYAAERGDIETIRKLIDTVDINSQDTPLGYSALTLAVQYHEHITKLLLQQPDINVNQHDKSRLGMNALLWASFRGTDSILKLLLEKKIEINARDKKTNSTALMFAATIENPANRIKMLLAVPGIDINAQNNHGFTALIEAADTGNIDAIKILLELPHIKINVRDKNGATAVGRAKLNEREHAARLIQAKIHELSIKAFGAVRAQNLESLKNIIAQIGVDNISDTGGNTLVDEACAINNPKIAAFLLQQADDPQALLARFPFEKLNPTTTLFQYLCNLAYMCEHRNLAEVESFDTPDILNKHQKLNLCAYCSKPATKKCSRCKKIHYCSPECQKADWQKHKKVCT